jgi:hypothetical protein
MISGSLQWESPREDGRDYVEDPPKLTSMPGELVPKVSMVVDRILHVWHSTKANGESTNHYLQSVGHIRVERTAGGSARIIYNRYVIFDGGW